MAEFGVPTAARPSRIDELLGGQLLAKLDQLDIMSRKIFSGKLQGERRSKKRGVSVEFADYRHYVHGDDLRFIDWNIYARLDRLFLKMFLEEEDLSLIIAVDTSRSMDWGNPSKFAFNQRLAMALGYIGLTNQNRVSLYAFGGGDVRPLSNLRGRRRTQEMGKWLLDLEPAGGNHFADAMRTIALGRQGKGVMLILSDFMFKEGYEKGLRYLSGGGYDTFCIQTLSPEEIDPGRNGLAGDLKLTDLEDDDVAEVTVSAALLKRYKANLDAYCGGLRDYCVRRAMMHITVDTATDMEVLLIDYMRKRGLLKEMQWLTPLTGAILAACVIPPLLLLYFLKLRRRRQPMACTILWQRSVEDLRANAPFQRLRFNLLLLLQLLALVLLALSVMQPQILGGDQGGGRTIMLLDRSASMEATDVDDGDQGGTRLDAAKEAMRDRIDTLYGGGFLERRKQGETMLIAFDDRAEVIARFTSSKGELLDAVDRIEGTHGGSSLDEALKLARAYATNVDPDSQRQVGPVASLELFSDGRIQDLEEQVLQRGEALVYYPIGDETSGNVSLGALDVKRPYDKPGSVEVFCALLNHGTEPVTCEVQLAVDGNARAVEDVALPAAEVDPASGAPVPGRNNLVFTPFPQPRSAVIEVANLRPDALMADNVAQVVVPPPKRLRVALLPPESGYLKEALQGMSLESLTLLTPANFEAKAASGGLDAYDVIVLDDWVPEGTLPPGRYFIFGKTPNVPGFNPFGMSGPQLVLNARTEHPALRFVVLDDLRAFEAQLVEPSDEVETIVEGSAGPLVMSLSRGALQIEYVAFPSTRSNWPILRSWIPFVFNSVEHLGTLGEGVTSRTWSVGEAFSARLPAEAEGITLALPDGTEQKLDVPDPTALTWGPIRRVGLYRVNWTAGDVADERPFAVNLDGEREGNIAAVPVLSVGQSTVEGVDPDASSYTPLWPWAIGLCLFVLMLEWWVYHRKSYV